MRKEKIQIHKMEPQVVPRIEQSSIATTISSQKMGQAVLYFIGGTVGIFLGASPFVQALQGVAVDAGVSVVVLAIVISPIAGEMPEKISMMLLARRGGTGASIAVANVLGSKILNNTLLLAVAVLAAVYHGGLHTVIPANSFLLYQMFLVTSITIVAIVPMLRRSIGLKTGIFLIALYCLGISIQFLLPQDLGLH
jgi:cation:H+ antiporter